MSEPAPVVVLVEDEPNIRRFVRMALESEGCVVHEEDTVRHGLIAAATRKPDLIVLDLGLPDGDGIELIRDLRTWSDLPVIVLSARAAESEKIRALDCGADDYLVKPFGAGELLARVRAQMRRRARIAGTAATSFSFGDVHVDLERRTVERAGTPLHLTPIEYRLLALLVTHVDRVLTQRQLLERVWGPGHAEDSHYLRVYMAQLRKKIEADPARPKHILTEAGVGYRFAG